MIKAPVKSIKSFKARQRGFTLIELLVTVAIIAVLAAIAIQSYNDYKERARDQEAQVALRMVVLAEEAYFSEFTTYVSCDETTCETLLKGVSKLRPGIELNFISGGGTCIGTASHVSGTGQVFAWSS